MSPRLSWLRNLTLTATATVTVSGAVLIGHAANADIINPVPKPSCNQSQPGCTVRVGDPGTPGDPGNGGGNGGASACHDPTGAVEACFLPALGFAGSDGCYYLRLDSASPPPGAPMPGAWYEVTCIGANGWLTGRNEWLATGQAPGPAILAQEAVNSLRLPTPQVELNPPPPAPQLLYVPTWVWLSEQSWTPQSATASVPGLSVTATARPAKLVLSINAHVAGANPTVVPCSGRGTPWQTGMD